MPFFWTAEQGVPGRHENGSAGLSQVPLSHAGGSGSHDQYPRQNGAVYVSDFAREAHQPLPAISRSLRQLEQDGLVLREADPADRRKTLVRITPELRRLCRCEDALSDYFACVMARLTPEQVQQMNVLRGALMDAILAENASREAKNNEGRTEL
mgnify:CR=1 FL=1